MRPAFRNTTCIFFMGLVFLPLFITFFFSIQRKNIRERMREKLESHNLVTIRVPENEVNWIEGDHEILVNGNMFDIKATRLENGIYSFTGLYDLEETNLRDQEKESREMADDNSIYTLLVNYNCGLFYDQNTIDLDLFVRGISIVDGYHCQLEDQAPNILTPPPQDGLATL